MSMNCNDEIFLSPESIIADLLVMTAIREDNAMGDRDDDAIPASEFNADDVETSTSETLNACDFGMK
jgi:hypothetical protein